MTYLFWGEARSMCPGCKNAWLPEDPIVEIPVVQFGLYSKHLWQAISLVPGFIGGDWVLCYSACLGDIYTFYLKWTTELRAREGFHEIVQGLEFDRAFLDV